MQRLHVSLEYNAQIVDYISAAYFKNKSKGRGKMDIKTADEGGNTLLLFFSLWLDGTSMTN